MKKFSPCLDILSSQQKKLWPKFANLPDHFVLYGGTSIALRLNHRPSEDFDFFTNQPLSADEIYSTLPRLKKATVLQREPTALTFLIENTSSTRCSFLSVPQLDRAADPRVAADNKLPIASLLDCFATKLAALLQRVEAKDYQDVGALIEHGIDLAEAISAMQAIYDSKFPPAEVVRTLTYFDEPPLNQLPQELKTTLIHAASELPHNLPKITPSSGLCPA